MAILQLLLLLLIVDQIKQKFPSIFKVVSKDPDFLVFKLFQASVAFHIEISHLFCSANQMIGFYIKRITGLKWLKYVLKINNNSRRWCKMKKMIVYYKGFLVSLLWVCICSLGLFCCLFCFCELRILFLMAFCWTCNTQLCIWCVNKAIFSISHILWKATAPWNRTTSMNKLTSQIFRRHFSLNSVGISQNRF